MIYLVYTLLVLIMVLVIMIILCFKKIQTQKQKMSNIVSDVLHAIQTPLTIMKGEIDLFSKTSNRVKLLNSLDRSIDRLSNYVLGEIKKLG